MPQPVVGPTESYVGPEALTRNPELATQIAIIVSAWADVENELGEILAGLFHHKSRAPVISGFYTLNSLPAKLDFLRAAAKKRLPPDLYRELSENIIPEIRRRSKERGTVVHGMWADSKQHPEALLLYPPIWQLVINNAVPMKYKKRDFENIVGRIYELREKLTQFSSQIHALMPDYPKSDKQ